mmetsp:Transcript_112906/g.358680  ORF Transcript_112906/g.358680 Transcript_112906/m.358680 type:complete len:266 (-) Transcript_112906:953-1750(-)
MALGLLLLLLREEPCQHADALDDLRVEAPCVEEVKEGDEGEHRVAGEHGGDHRRDDHPHGVGMDRRKLRHTVVGVVAPLLVARSSAKAQRSWQREPKKNIENHGRLHHQHQPSANAACQTDNVAPALVIQDARQEIVTTRREHELPPTIPTLPGGQVDIGSQHVRGEDVVRDAVVHHVAQAHQAAAPKTQVEDRNIDLGRDRALELGESADEENHLHRPRVAVNHVNTRDVHFRAPVDPLQLRHESIELRHVLAHRIPELASLQH